MIIKQGEKIADVPAIKLRNALRGVERISESYIRRRCKLRKAATAKVLSALVEKGYLKPDGDRYIVTGAGGRFRSASATPKIPRSNAEEIIGGVLKRVAEINQADYAYRVSAVVVFGSFARNESNVGDVDIAVQLESRHHDQAKQRRHKAKRIDSALEKGRRFPNVGTEVCWPRQEVYLHLKNRVRGLSLHSFHDFLYMERDDTYCYRVLFGDAKWVAEQLKLNSNPLPA